MNETYGSEPDGQIFKLPEPRIKTAVATVPGQDGQKMSKSYGNTIDLFGEEKETRKRVMAIVTDSTPVDSPKDPDNSTIVQLYSLVANEKDVEAMRNRFRAGGTGYGDFKKELFEKLWAYFEPMRKRREEILADPKRVDDVLARGAEKARAEAEKVMIRVRQATRAPGEELNPPSRLIWVAHSSRGAVAITSRDRELGFRVWERTGRKIASAGRRNPALPRRVRYPRKGRI